MDKQKQIKEMAKVKIGAILEQVNMGDGYADIDSLADEIYHITIPEGAVVLTEEELKEKIDCCDVSMIHHDDDGKKYIEYEKYEDFTDRLGKRIQQLKGQLKQERKETAEKFERLANERIAKEQGERDGYDAYRIDNKAKYDGDIVSFVLFEICKEIAEGKV